MTKITNTGPRPIPEDVPDASKANDTPKAPINPSDTTAPEQIAADKYVAGDLKTAGDQMKSQLESQLRNADTVAGKNAGLSPEQIAKKAAEGQQRFAPPYVPVGPVVMGDNISTPGHVANTDTTEIGLRPDQFQINDEGQLVISNQKLIEYFKSLKESGQDILLGITNRKPTGEE